MNDEIIKVGNKVRRGGWAAKDHPGEYVEIEWVGDGTFAGLNVGHQGWGGHRDSYSYGENTSWELAPEPPRERRYDVWCELRVPELGEHFVQSRKTLIAPRWEIATASQTRLAEEHWVITKVTDITPS